MGMKFEAEVREIEFANKHYEGCPEPNEDLDLPLIDFLVHKICTECGADMGPLVISGIVSGSPCSVGQKLVKPPRFVKAKRKRLLEVFHRRNEYPDAAQGYIYQYVQAGII